MLSLPADLPPLDSLRLGQNWPPCHCVLLTASSPWLLLLALYQMCKKGEMGLGVISSLLSPHHPRLGEAAATSWMLSDKEVTLSPTPVSTPEKEPHPLCSYTTSDVFKS